MQVTRSGYRLAMGESIFLVAHLGFYLIIVPLNKLRPCGNLKKVEHKIKYRSIVP